VVQTLISISVVAARASGHRSFIHRHPDLRAAALNATAETLTQPSPTATAISYRSVVAENDNLRQYNRRLVQHISDLQHDWVADPRAYRAFEYGAGTR
jgi:hypothetical protein